MPHNEVVHCNAFPNLQSSQLPPACQPARLGKSAFCDAMNAMDAMTASQLVHETLETAADRSTTVLPCSQSSPHLLLVLALLVADWPQIGSVGPKVEPTTGIGCERGTWGGRGGENVWGGEGRMRKRRGWVNGVMPCSSIHLIPSMVIQSVPESYGACFHTIIALISHTD